MNLTFGGRYRKSATVVGEVLGNTIRMVILAVYDSMVGMAQDFSYRYPLISGQGNFGSIDGDKCQAGIYRSLKCSKISSIFCKI